MELGQLIGLIVLLALALAIVIIAVRRTVLSRIGGFDVCWRAIGATGASRGWSLGQGRYRGGELGLYRSFSPLPMAARRLDRTRLELGATRPPVGTEPDLLPRGVVIVTCRDGSARMELALSEPALTGLRSWIEARPARTSPGSGDLGGVKEL